MDLFGEEFEFEFQEELRKISESHVIEEEILSEFLQDEFENSHLINVGGSDVSKCIKFLYNLLHFRLPSIFISTVGDLHDRFVKNLSIPNANEDLYIINLDELHLPSDYLRLDELLSSDFNSNKSTYKLILVRSESLSYIPINVSSQSSYQ